MITRKLSTSCAYFRKVSPTNLKGKSTSSQNWITRQLADPYVEKAKVMNFRCRSAFKLLEIDERFHILHPGDTVIDCGAAPGSWSQVVADKTSKMDDNLHQGMIIAIDKQQIFPIKGVNIIGNADFTAQSTQDMVADLLNGKKANIVMSDMAPSASGIRDLDTENIINLCYAVLQFALKFTVVNGTLLMKLWQCGQTNQLKTDMETFYGNVKIVKPNASRSDSAEIFLLGREFKGIK